jgi:hypothetical protein
MGKRGANDNRRTKVNYGGFVLLAACAIWSIMMNGFQSASLIGFHQRRVEEVPSEEKVIQPPFHFVQIGSPRTASTFQHQLLIAMAALKSPFPLEKVKLLNTSWSRERLQANASYVFKTHRKLPLKRFKRINPQVHVFVSSDDYSDLDPIYIQKKENVVKCSLCEVDNYKPYFDLTDDEIKEIKRYMSVWEKLRRCCGYQMSKFQRAKLHGCNITEHFTEYDEDRDDPKCDQYNITQLEYGVQQYNVPIAEIYGWKEPGDCAKIDQRIARGRDFNNRPFRGCKSVLIQDLKGKTS